MRVLHAPLEIAGQAALSADGLVQIGHDARTLLLPHPWGYARSHSLPLIGAGRRTRQVQRVAYTPYVLARFDAFHFHNGTSMVPLRRYIDARVARRLGRRVVVEFYGADVRLPSVERARNPWYVESPNDNDRVNQERMKVWAEVTGGHVVVADHFADDFLREHFAHIHVVGQRVDLRRIAPRPPRPDTRVPVLLHAPSNNAVKGTSAVRAAVEALERRGRSFRYVELSGVPAARVVDVLADADLVVDQLRLGSHGVFAAEAMAAAKPVICHVSEHLRPTYPVDLPIIDATPATIEAVLDQWLADHQGRHERGVASHIYAERVHDHVKVAERLVDVYNGLPRR